MDGAIKGNPRDIVYEGVAHDHNGRSISAMVLPLRTKTNYYAMEYEAYLGIKMAYECKIDRIWVESDS